MSSLGLIVVDLSAILAVLLNEPTRQDIEVETAGAVLGAPGCLPWEFGNAMYNVIKRGRITTEEATLLLTEFEEIPIRRLKVDMEEAIRLAASYRLPTYDAYYLQCALALNRPLITLDTRMTETAIKLGVALIGLPQ